MKSMLIKILVSAIAPVIFVPAISLAENVGQKAQEAAQDAAKETKQLFREAKDEVCEMVNGKLHCLKQKVKGKAANVNDEAKDKAEDAREVVR